MSSVEDDVIGVATECQQSDVDVRVQTQCVRLRGPTLAILHLEGLEHESLHSLLVCLEQLDLHRGWGVQYVPSRHLHRFSLMFLHHSETQVWG